MEATTDDEPSPAPPPPPPSYAPPGHVQGGERDDHALLTSLRGATTSDELSTALDALRHAIEHRDATVVKVEILSTAQTWRKANQALWTPAVGLRYGAVVRAFGDSDIVERREEPGGHEEGVRVGANAGTGGGGGGQGGDDWLSEVTGEEKRASRDLSAQWMGAAAIGHSGRREEGKSEGAESVVATDGPDEPPPKNALLLLCGWRDEGDPHIAAEALIEGGIDIEEKDESGRTALIIAAYVSRGNRRREGEKERRREGDEMEDNR